MKKKLSVVLATYNEEENIKDCLDSVKNFADEIIIVDGSSTDNTAAIAKKYGAKVFIVPNQIMFHKNKQLGLEKATGEWILQLDADERVAPELKKEILEILKSEIREPKSEINGYYIPRKNWFLTKFLTKGGQYPDYVIRLVKKGKARFPCLSVHEQIEVQGKVGYLKNPLIHLGNADFSVYLRNFNRYTTLTAIKLAQEKIPLTFLSQLKFILWLPFKTFFLIFFRHKGFVDGLAGFIFAFFSGLHYLVAFIKYWEKENNPQVNLEKEWE